MTWLQSKVTYVVSFLWFWTETFGIVRILRNMKEWQLQHHFFYRSLRNIMQVTLLLILILLDLLVPVRDKNIPKDFIFFNVSAMNFHVILFLVKYLFHPRISIKFLLIFIFTHLHLGSHNLNFNIHSQFQQL